MPRFIDNGDGTISDTKTGLLWQKSDDEVRRTWHVAKEYAETLTLAEHSDWRLPTIEELIGIIDYKCYDPACASIFTCRSSHYWSGSTCAGYTYYAWAVHFYVGYVYAYDKTFNDFYVRCVREEESSSCQS